MSGKVSATDADGDTLTFAKDETPDAGPHHGTVTVAADGSWTYTPDKDYNGADSFKITVSDGKGGTATATVDIGVNPVNDPPKLTDPDGNVDPVTGHYQATTDEDKPVSGKVSATDVDGDALTFAKGSDPAHGTVTVDANGKWTYTPDKDYNGPDSFTVTVDDLNGDTAGVVVQVPIAPNADPLGFAPTATVGAPDSAGVVTGRVSADPMLDIPVTYVGSTTTGKGTVVVNPDGTFTYTPTAQARQAAAAPRAAATGANVDSFVVTLIAAGILFVTRTIDPSVLVQHVMQVLFVLAIAKEFAKPLAMETTDMF